MTVFMSTITTPAPTTTSTTMIIITTVIATAKHYDANKSALECASYYNWMLH